MPEQIFIFTAGNVEAKKHLEETIKKRINFEMIKEFFDQNEQETLERINKEHGLYAWGAIPGKNNEKLWKELKQGDYVFCVYKNTYHYFAKVLQKFRNKECAKALWGIDNNGQTWELMYFLSKPEKIEIPVPKLSNYLNIGYMGFTKISQDKINKIKKEYGNLSNFIDDVIFVKGGNKNKLDRKDMDRKDMDRAIERVISFIENKGFIYEPWQICQYITAVRTKPFVILAGITGTGKSKLPALVAEATKGESRLIPVRPDWTDSSDVLGYFDLQGNFQPGSVMQIAREAMNDQRRFWTCIIDEMNLARVEHYFAEILSRIEDRYGDQISGYKSKPLLSCSFKEKNVEWENIILPPNLCIVGTVNMDESAHGFSRKVLDRAFTIELSEVYLDVIQQTQIREEVKEEQEWTVENWYPRAIRLSELKNLNEEEKEEINRAIEALKNINELLIPAQLQIGYRTRDEVVLFLIHASEIKNLFKDRKGDDVDPLDLVLQMKILPRIVGGTSAIRRVVLGLLGWAIAGKSYSTDEDARPIIDDWEKERRPMAIKDAKYPRFAARLCLMWERLMAEGYTSYWL